MKLEELKKELEGLPNDCEVYLETSSSYIPEGASEVLFHTQDEAPYYADHLDWRWMHKDEKKRAKGALIRI